MKKIAAIQPTNTCPPGQQHQARSECDFDHARGDDHDIGVDRQPGRNLSAKRGSAEAQMTDTGEYQKGTQSDTRDAARPRERGAIDDGMTHQLIVP